MRKITKCINAVCHECNPGSYEKTLAKYSDGEELIEVVGNPADNFMEYLYECCQCGAIFWIDEQMG